MYHFWWFRCTKNIGLTTMLALTLPCRQISIRAAESESEPESESVGVGSRSRQNPPTPTDSGQRLIRDSKKSPSRLEHFLSRIMWWTGWIIDTEPSPALLCIADMANGRNSGLRHIPAPMSEMWRLVWTEYLLFFAIILDQLTKLFEHSPYQWHRRDASDVQIIILSIHQTRSQKGFSYAMEGAVTRPGLGPTGSGSGQE